MESASNFVAVGVHRHTTAAVISETGRAVSDENLLAYGENSVVTMGNSKTRPQRDHGTS